MDKKVILSLKNISFSYGKELILNNISLDIYDKEFITLLGPSGCGKTTTLRIIAGFEKPDKGEVYFDSVLTNDVPPYKRNVNTVFQKYALFPHLNVYDNVAFGLKEKGLPKDEINKKVLEMLSVVDLKGYEKRKVSNLSGGQQQRVAIARALVCDPEIVLLDEPLGALDLKLRKDMQIELKQIQQKAQKTFIYVTHDQEEALTMSDRVVVMNNGVIAQVGTALDVYNEPVNAFVADFIGEANILNATMIEDCKVKIFDDIIECVDKGFGVNTPVDVVIRPEDIIIVDPKDGQFTGIVEDVVFKGVFYQMQVRVKDCIWLIQSTKASDVGQTIGMRVDPYNIQIMNKMFACENNELDVEITWNDEHLNECSFMLEHKEIVIKDTKYKKGDKLHISLPPDAIFIAGSGKGQLQEVYIESVIWKGAYNEIILESDERKWLMQSEFDEQVATYVNLSFDFSKAIITNAKGEEDEK